MAIDIPSELAALAARQHGVVTRQQLLAIGLGHHAIAYRVRAGDLYRVHLGVYAVGKPPVTPLERASAAVLACGTGAALSHASAMVLWGFWKRWPASFEVIVAGHHRRPGINVHRCSTLHRRDLTRHLGIRVTTPARTLHDCAPRLSDRALARAAGDALHSRFLTRDHLAEFLARHPNTRLLRFATATDNPTRSWLEDEFLEFCERYGLPHPRTNVIVAGREADAYFEAERLIVEVDSWEFHSSRESFEDDRDRDANALVYEIGTVRITRERIRNQPDREAARLLAILAGRRRR